LLASSHVLCVYLIFLTLFLARDVLTFLNLTVTAAG
jgi:hypothetical protein